MKQQGVIFHYPSHRSKHVSHNVHRVNIYKAIMLGGLLGLIAVFSPIAVMEGKYRMSSLFKKPIEQVVVTAPTGNGSFDRLINKKQAQALKPVDTSFSLIIPKIGINSKVYANIDPGNKDAYIKALETGIAHADGTYLPGQNGTVYLFAHSTDYIWNINRFNAVFYLLKELSYGDQVDVVYQGQLYTYNVTDKRVVAPDDTYYLKPVKGEERLILQTCWPPGTTWKRLLIFARADRQEQKQLSYSP